MLSKEEGDKYSFINNPIEMINPMSKELVSFRQTLIPSLIKNINQNKSVSNIKIFEIANVYLPTPADLPLEEKKLALLANVDYFRMKGIVESILNFAKVKKIKFLPAKPSYLLNPSLSVDLYLDSKQIGKLGLLNSKILYENSLEGNYAVAELDMNLLSSNFNYLEKVRAKNKIPAIIEDITYHFNGNNWWQLIESSLTSKFNEIAKIELIDTFKENITFRIYSYPKTAKSILKEIIVYLEKDLNTKIVKG
jgi:phenylalanyl-tRNA synthetase beta subunit